MNIKVLTRQERLFFLERYKFEREGNTVFVHINNYRRVTAHKIDDGINITSKVRRIKISSTALKYWAMYFESKYSPIEVQNAMNFLTISYKPISAASIEEAIHLIAEQL